MWDAFEEVNKEFPILVLRAYHRLCNLLDNNYPNFDQLKFVTTTPQPSGEDTYQVPNPWDLDDPNGPWMRKIRPRVFRREYRQF